MARHYTAVADGKGNKLTTKKNREADQLSCFPIFFVIVVIPLI